MTMNAALNPAWTANERVLWNRRIREALIGDRVRFPNDFVVVRAEWSFEVYEGTQKLNLTNILGGQPIPDRNERISKIVDYILERIDPMPTQPAPTTPATDVQNGRSGGSRHSTTPVANGNISTRAYMCLKDIADAGGEVKLETLLENYHTAIPDKLLVEKMIEPTDGGKVALTPTGVQYLEDRRVTPPSAPSAANPPAPEPTPERLADPVDEEPESAPTANSLALLLHSSFPTPETTSTDCTCQHCKYKLMLDMIMMYSPAAREAVEHFTKLDATLERMRGV